MADREGIICSFSPLPAALANRVTFRFSLIIIFPSELCFYVMEDAPGRWCICPVVNLLHAVP